jgi:FHS family L-fucose permease-like MFS transporter
MWGFITVMNDVLINTFGDLFSLGASQLSLIQLSFFGTFFAVSLLYFAVSSITKQDPINRIGYKNGMAISLAICALGCSSFYIAGINEAYGQFLFSLFVLSIGVTFLQICANPYVTILGPEKTGSSRLNLAQGFNSLGTTLGPIIGNVLIYSVFSSGKKSISAVGSTYLLYGVVFALMALVVLLSKLPSFTNETKVEGGLSVLRNRNLRFGVLAIFFYVGSEVSVGSWVGTFGKDPDIMGLSEQSANYFLAFFWGGLMIGRLMASISLSDKLSKSRKYYWMLLTSLAVFFLIWSVTGIKMQSGDNGMSILFDPIALSSLWIYGVFMLINYFAFIIGNGRAASLIVVFCTINGILLLIGIFSSGQLAFWSVLGTGLFFSVGWSNIFSLSIKGLGAATSQGSSLLVMAIVGGAAIPYIQGITIDKYNVQLSFIYPLIGMIYLIFFGLNGYKRNTDKTGPVKSS